jgi:hypothetical protein
MKNEINRDYYCSANCYKPDESCKIAPVCGCIKCKNYHRKYPTPEQFKEEYGKEWEGAAYFTERSLYNREGDLYICNNWSEWEIMPLSNALDKADVPYHHPARIVCACTPFGRPDNGWRPE